MKSLLATISTAAIILCSAIANAQQPASSVPSDRCAVAKSTTVEQTADGRTVIRVKSVKVCK